MNELNLAFAFSAGMLATINPCGWAMLPAFVAYYLGSEESDYRQRPVAQRLYQALWTGLLVTLGFLVVFGGAGLIFSAALQLMVRIAPLIALLVGFALVLLGFWLLTGRSLSLVLPMPEADFRVRSPKTLFLFGLAYALASLSCTLPIFLVVVGATLTSSGLGESAAMLLSYAAGMATVLMSVAVGAALLKSTFSDRFRALLPYVHRLGALLLIASGLYIMWFQGKYLPFIRAAF